MLKEMNNTCNKFGICPDHRLPSYFTFSSCPQTRQGFLPAGAYGFSREGSVWDDCDHKYESGDQLIFKVNGPKYGPTMGSCFPRGTFSNVNNYAATFTPRFQGEWFNQGTNQGHSRGWSA